MAEGEGFGVLLERLAQRRQLDLDGLARSADVSESELLSLLRDGGPSPSLLRRLAPTLGLHTPDLFVIAGVEVPDDLAPVDSKAGSWVPHLIRNAIALSPEQRNVLREFVASLPQEAHTPPAPRPPAFEQYPNDPGAVVMRLARNRNLGWTAVAKTFLVVTGRYWSAATYGGVGRGTTPLTAELLADFCAVLDVPRDDLSTVTGVALPDASSRAKPTIVGVAELIWDVRRLTQSQLQEARNLAESLQR
jgi:transcriptional regulator with XRE-family HTH domain